MTMDDYQEDIPVETWEAWNRLLTPTAQQQLRSARGTGSTGIKTNSLRPKDQLPALHALALELRDRLRFSQKRVVDLKAELATAQYEIGAEKQRTATRLMVFEAEIERLKQGAIQHAKSLDTHAQLTWQLQADLAQAQAQVQAAQAEAEACKRQAQVEAQASAESIRRQVEAQAQDNADAVRRQVQADIGAARAQSDEYRQQLDDYRQELQAQAQADNQAAMAALQEADRRASDAEARADAAESQKADVLEELKNITAQIDDVAARAENQGKTQVDLLGALVASKTRLSEMYALEGLYCEAQDELKRLDKENLELKDMWQRGVSELGTSRICEALPAGTHKLGPASLLPAYTGIKKGAKGKKKHGWIQDCVCDGGMQPVGRCSANRSLPGPGPASLPNMAYLGPSSRMYPPDPDSYVYLRVGGGYDPKHVGTEELPKASGWVPKDVVKVLQAFRHAYKLHSPDWEFWEPLLLLIDEVYRTYQRNTLTDASISKPPCLMAPHVQLPAVVQNSRIAGLKRQLENMRRSLGMHETRDTSTLRKMAEKEYHLTNQLDEAINQNVQLRQAVEQLRQSK